MAIHRISDKTYDELEKLSEKEIDKLAEILSIGFLNEDADKEEKIFIIANEQPESELIEALKKIRVIKSR